MKCVFFCVLFYTLSFPTLFAIEKQEMNLVTEANLGPVLPPFLQYRFLGSNGGAWQNAPMESSSLPPLTSFEGRFFLLSKTGNSVVLEWPDNKIEFLQATVQNRRGDTVAVLHYHDVDGFSSPFFIKNQVLSFPHPKPNEVYSVQYHMLSHNSSYPICSVQATPSFFSRFIKEYTWYGLLAGIVLTVFSLNLLLYASHRESTFFWYALYTVSLGVFQWSYTGVGYQWLWPHWTQWNRYSYMISSFLMICFQFVYLYYYTKRLNPIRPRHLLAVILFRFVILGYSLWFPAFSKWHLLLDFLTLVFQVWMMNKVLLQKTLHGRLYMLSISTLAFSYLIFMAAYYQFIETNYFTYNAFALGGIVDLIIGMLALALRFKYLSDEKEKLQDNEIASLKAIADLKEQVVQEAKEKARIQKEVNVELEAKIRLRTMELAQKNEKLEELNDKLLDMSSQLDKQNWVLNKELVGDRLKLMWGKDIRFEEFQQTFPSEKHIFRFISSLKWQESFQCKKCGGSEWKEGAQYLSRKCSVCLYEESVTANTLFHGVKFPLVKALYISLHTVIHRDEVPVHQLSQEIDLREATVWAFRKKTLEKLATKNTGVGDVLRSLVA
jgi:hypothetical protein